MAEIDIKVVEALTAEQKELCYRVRYDVFIKETGYIQKPNEAGLEKDAYDGLDTTFHFLAFFDGEPAGTVRLLMPNRNLARMAGTSFGLPIEDLFDISCYLKSSLRIAEISRSCVKHRYKSTRTIFYLWKELIASAVERGVTDLVTNVNPETDSLSDAKLIYEHVKLEGLVDSDIAVRPRTRGAGKTSGFRFPLMFAARRDAGKPPGGCVELQMPQTLKLFIKVGILFTGEPVYSEKIDMCAMPMNWRLKDIEKNAFRKFLLKERVSKEYSAA